MKYEKQNRQGLSLSKDSKEFHRVQYSLKMALRMINGTFEQLEVQQLGNTSALDDDSDKTTLECWYKPADP